MDGRVERNDGTDVCCTKLQKTKETGLVFSQLVDPTGVAHFFRFGGNLGGACHSTGCLVFFQPWWYPKVRAQRAPRTCPAIEKYVFIWCFSSCLEGYKSEMRLGLHHLVGRESVFCRVRLARYLGRWWTFHLPTGRPKIGTR